MSSYLSNFRARARHFIFRLTRPMTMGAQAIVFDAQDRVFLVRHTYTPGWHFPGGGVEPGESVRESLRRELQEEGNIVLDGPAELHGLFYHDRYSRRDHIAVYIVRSFHQTAPRLPDREIAEGKFFSISALPVGTSKAVHARLREISLSLPPSDRW